MEKHKQNMLTKMSLAMDSWYMEDIFLDLSQPFIYVFHM